MGEQFPQATLPATVFQMDAVPQPRADESMLDELQPADRTRCAEQAGRVLARVAAKAASDESAGATHDAGV